LKDSAIHVIPIIVALVVAIAPHTPGLPLWIILWCFFMWGYMLVQLKTGWPVPGPILRHILAFAGIIGLLATFRIQIGADAFVGLMAVMAAIKPFEMATHRHQMIALLLTYFIIITSLFRSESLWIVLYMFFSVFVTTMALIRINHPKGRFRSSITLAGQIMGLAIPLMVMLFLFFPRLQQGLFSMETPATGKSGFSETLGPGSISRMALDQSVAFRAEFDGPLPQADSLYWRGIVFDRFNGTQWFPAKTPAFITPGRIDSTDPVIHTIILEPHNSRWLFALDRPISSPPGADLTAGHTLLSKRPVTRKQTYNVMSRIDPLEKSFENTGTRLPDPVFTGHDNNPKARHLARSLAGNIPGVQAKTDRILAYFKEEKFTYTLTPPLGGADPMDAFLLETRQGYCEHYAGALAFMMNVVNVPARVVGGYLGGEFNPYGNHVTIRQSFAHAWVEVFIPDKGWIRVDPTLAVAPERLEQNPDGSFSYSTGAARNISVMKKLTFMLEAVNLKWESWFIGYSFSGQMALLRQLGLGTSFGTWAVATLLLSLSILVLTVFFWLFFYRIDSDKNDPVAGAYALFCKRLERIGLKRYPDQGPVDFLRMVTAKRPDLEKKAKTITDMYIQLRFHKTCPDNLTRQLITHVRQFKPYRLENH
jgi:protein-glutamine gamma-glutamyltransferase